MKSWIPITLVVVAGAQNVALAQMCTVGKRCGNTCISRDDVCHIGSGEGGGESSIVGLGVGLAVLGAVALGVLIWQASPRGESPGPLDSTIVLREQDRTIRVIGGRSPKLAEGDVIASVNGRAVHTYAQYQLALSHSNLGKCVGKSEIHMHVFEPKEKEFCLSQMELGHLTFQASGIEPRSSRLDLSVEADRLFVGVQVPF